MQQYVVLANIERFRNLLDRERDEKQRAVIAQLLEAELAKLASPSEAPQPNPPPSSGNPAA